MKKILGFLSNIFASVTRLFGQKVAKSSLKVAESVVAKGHLSNFLNSLDFVQKQDTSDGLFYAQFGPKSIVSQR